MAVKVADLNILKQKLHGYFPHSRVIAVCKAQQHYHSHVLAYVQKHGQMYKPHQTANQYNSYPQAQKYRQMLADVTAYLESKEPSTRKYYVDKWPQFSCVIAVPYSSSDPVNMVKFEVLEEIICFARDAESMKSVLETEGIIPWNRKIRFGGIEIGHFDAFKEVIAKYTDKEVTHSDLILVHTYMTQEQDIPTFDPPENMTIDKLTLTDATQVHREWEYGKYVSNSEQYVSWHVENRPSVAVREQDGTLIGYELLYYLGAMGLLYVKPQYRGKGIAKFIITEMARKTLRTGHDAFVFIVEGNLKSETIHMKCGFKKIGNQIFWVNI